MHSLLIPSNVSVSITGSTLCRVGPKGSFRVSVSGFNVAIIPTSEGKRLIIASTTSKTPVSTVLSLLSRRIEGISVGYRHRLRLVGVGFRALISEKSIAIKIGYSHDVFLDSEEFKKFGVSVTPSRIDGRSKGTIIQFESNSPFALFHQINRIQRFRRPDPYKAKGIHIDGQVIRRKKGKREA